MRFLSTLAKLILSFNLLPLRVAMVESRWITGRSLGQGSDRDIDSEIDSFVRRESAEPPTRET